jgi:hypothetical protein
MSEVHRVIAIGRYGEFSTGAKSKYRIGHNFSGAENLLVAKFVTDLVTTLSVKEAAPSWQRERLQSPLYGASHP